MNIINRISIKMICFSACMVIAVFMYTGSALAEELELDVQSAEVGQNVVFTITVKNAPNRVTAFALRVLFNGDCLTWQSLTLGDLTQDFPKEDPATGDPTGALLANEPSPGLLIVVGATAFEENGIQKGETGVMVTLTFSVDDCCSTDLVFSDLTDHITTPYADHEWTTKSGRFFCGDRDMDGILDAADNCISVYNPTQTDTDNDGFGDACDNCPTDPDKFYPGICGCNVPDTDSDGDGAKDCIDGCPEDPNKTAPGVCGCGNPDTDTDGDGTPDCIDDCPNDPDKTAPGVCGCGVSDTDSDGDGSADCIDGCPEDPNKTAPGECGCGTPDTDTDGDGTPDCKDNDDSDNDGIKDKHDNCPNVPNSDQTDTDGDGRGDACDGCPDDPDKTVAGVCGCNVPDTDTDGDGAADCIDECPNNPDKTEPGVCGCSKADIDRDGDGDIDCPGGGSSSWPGCFLDAVSR